MKALLFDLWDTLVISKNFVQSLQTNLNQNNLSLPEFHKRLALCCFTHPYKDYTSLVKDLFKEFGIKLTQEKLQSTVYTFDNFRLNASLFPDTPSIFPLKKHYKFALISNTISPHFTELLDSLQLTNWFDFIYPSFKAGVIKPTQSIYKETLKQLKIKPQDAVMISNSISDLDGARSLSIHTLLIDRENTSSYAPKITTLKKLPNYLEALKWK